jgi:hypothetical protein
MLACRHCHAFLPFVGQVQVRAILRRKGLPAELCAWLCCIYGVDAQYLPQMRERWRSGSLRAYPAADCHHFRPQDFPVAR